MSTAASAHSSSNTFAPRGAAAAPGSGVAIDPVRLLKKYYTLLLGALFAGAIIGAGVHLILAQVYPMYTSAATFACTAQATSVQNPILAPMAQDELIRFMGTQMATMTSTPVLGKILDEPDVLRTSWAKQFEYRGNIQKQNAQPELEKALVARPLTQTNLIRLSMTWKNPEDVRTIVDAATRVYMADLRDVGSKETQGRREVLLKEINDLDLKIQARNAERNGILGDNQITDINAVSAEADVKTKELSERYVQTISAKAAVDSQYERYSKMQEDNQVIQYPDNVRESANKDPLVLQQDEQVSNYRTELATLRGQGYGEEHPAVIAMKKRIDAANQERQDVFDRTLRKLFDGEVEQLRNQVLSLEATRKQVRDELEIVGRRKQDLTGLAIRLRQIEEDVKTKTEDRAENERALKQIGVLLSNPVFDRVRLIISAQKPDNMSFPQLKIMIPLGMVLITGLTAGLVVLREVLDQRVRGPADLATMARIRVLGLVSDAQEDPTRPANLATAFRDAPTGVTAESFRLLRAPVVKAMDQQGHKTLLVLGGMPGSGTTTVATNLGLACAGADERILIIDANLRRPGVQKAFGLPEGPGLGDVLAGAVKLEGAVRPTSAENLFVLTVGSAAHRVLPERLASESIARLLNDAKGKFDRIIIDSAPAIVSGDGLALAHRVDAVVLVVRALSEKRGLVARLRNQLGECRGEFLGVVINAVRASAGGYLRGNIKATHEYQHGSQAA
jgi:capsular exopolysaccharide synthesis family protein